MTKYISICHQQAWIIAPKDDKLTELSWWWSTKAQRVRMGAKYPAQRVIRDDKYHAQREGMPTLMKGLTITVKFV